MTDRAMRLGRGAATAGPFGVAARAFGGPGAVMMLGIALGLRGAGRGGWARRRGGHA